MSPRVQALCQGIGGVNAPGVGVILTLLPGKPRVKEDRLVRVVPEFGGQTILQLD